jgi:pSer/pThr/pTyr-binding forkhead associated (FHA) protein
VRLLATDQHGQPVGEIAITAQPAAIGRGVQCALQINGMGVSRVHATVYLHQQGVVIQDEQSANGVMVDGRLITGPTLIDDSNVVQISSFLLQVVGGSQPIPVAVPDDAFEAEDFDTRLEVHEGAAEALATAAKNIVLVGRGGPYDSTIMRLDQLLSTVGRDQENQIVLEDPSVSRRHAQLRVSVAGDKVTVLDLRSSNGTFVNGDRIKRAEASVGDVIRFGDLGFKLENPGAAGTKSTKTRSPRKRLFIALASIVVLIGGAGGLAWHFRPKAPIKKTISPEDYLRRRQAKVQRLVDQANRKLAKQEWSAAILLFDKVLLQDPLHSDSKALRKKALDELSNQKTYERAMKFFALGNRENLIKARKIFTEVPKTSIYARETRYKIKTIDERVAEGYRIDGVSRCKARYYKTCYRLLCKYFRVMPKDVAVVGEPALRRRMAAVEKRYRRRRRFRKCKAPRYVNPTRQYGKEDPKEALASKYPNDEVRRVVMLYFDGKIDVALKRIAKLRKKRRMRPHQATLSEIQRQLLVVRGKYQEGYSFIRQRKLKSADRELGMMFTADRSLVPKADSFYRREAKKALSALYAEMGAEDFKVKHYRDAFKKWARGKQIDASNASVLNGLLKLESEAEQLLKDGKQQYAAGNLPVARQKLELARDICLAETSTKKNVLAALKRLE